MGGGCVPALAYDEPRRGDRPPAYSGAVAGIDWGGGLCYRGRAGRSGRSRLGGLSACRVAMRVLGRDAGVWPDLGVWLDVGGRRARLERRTKINRTAAP